MSDINHAGSDFISRGSPPFHQALVGAITHLLAIFVPMVTPALIVGAAYSFRRNNCLSVSMAMIASGIGTGLQVKPGYGHRRFWPTSIQSVKATVFTKSYHVNAAWRILRWRISGCRLFIYLGPTHVGLLRLLSAVLWY